MSIATGRVVLAVLCAGWLVCVVWCVSAWLQRGSWSDVSALAAAVGVVAAIGMGAAALLFARFVDADADGEEITVRRVLGPQRVIRVSQVDEVVVLQALHLPARHGSSASPRVVLRGGGRTIAGFTPRSATLLERLVAQGLAVTVLATPMTPVQAHRRYRGSVSLAEVLTVPVLWAAVLVPVAVVLWVVGDAASG
ncbi:MAG: hypothetical protein ACTMIR_12765 [Cellulomonadaceae bacterium]